jgi:hypothetical protein
MKNDTRVVEYLYNRGGRPFRILKKTKQRIYYDRNPFQEDNDNPFHFLDANNPKVGYVNRQEIERNGEAWSRSDRSEIDALLSLKWPLRPYVAPRAPKASKAPAPDLQKLKAEMAAAHPDRGGTSAAFIEARKRYIEARRALRQRKAA